MNHLVPKSFRRRARRASALVMVLIFLITLSVIGISMIHRVTSENRVAHAHFASLRARNALDATIDYGIGQIVKRSNSAALDPAGIFTPEGSAPLRPPTAASFSADADSLDRTRFEALELCAAQSVAVLSGDIVNTGKFYVDPADADNAKDPLRGQYIRRNLIALIARGAAVDPLRPDAAKTAHGFALVERRDGFMFNYAVFFSAASLRVRNLAGTMHISGPTYSNKDMFVTLTGGSTRDNSSRLSFDGTLSIAGSIIDKASRISSRTYFRIRRDSGVFDYTNDRDPGTFNLQTNFAGTEYGQDRLWTSADGDVFKARTDNNGGYLQTAAHGVQPIYPIGTTAAGSTTSTVTDPLTGASYSLENERTIDPPRKGILTSDDPSLDSAKAAESEKLALKASLYVLVEQSDGAADRNAAARVIAFNNPADAIAYKALSPDARSAWLASDSNRSKLIDLSAQVSVPAPVSARPERIGFNKGGQEVRLKSLPTETLYDAHQKSTVSTVTIDLGKLNQAIASGSITRMDRGATPWNVNSTVSHARTSPIVNPSSTAGWNGILYVDVENPNRLLAGSESLHYANQINNDPDPGRTAVRLVNAASIPTSKVGEPGFTFATNAPVYIKGNFNADGDMATGTSRASDSSAEKPAAIWADQVTTLSSNHHDYANLTVTRPSTPSMPGFDANDLLSGTYTDRNGMTVPFDNWPFKGTGSRGTSSGFQYTNQELIASNIEIAAAIVSGDRFDDSQGIGTSNGLQNFVPQIERFNSAASTLRIRGSLVNLWAPKYFTGAYRNEYFQNPSRDFGYSDNFKNGAMPPGTPAIRAYRKLRYREISEATYLALKENPDQSTRAWIELLAKLDADAR